VILGASRGAAAVAVFAVSLQVRNVFYSLSTTMSNVFVPLVNRIVAETDDNDQLTKVMTRVGRYQALLFFWVYGGFVVLGPWFVRAWAGTSFSEAYFLVLAMAGPLFIPLTQSVGIEIQRAKNMHRARSLAYLCLALTNLAITWLLAPSLNYWAPVVGYVMYIGLGCGAFMNWYYQRRVGLDMSYFWQRVMPIAGSCVITVAICLLGTRWLPVDGLMRFLLWGATYTTLFALLSWFHVFDASEKEALVTLLGKIRGSEKKRS
jgi:O-antigen/teichoic acid export membrane protein